MLDSGFRGSVVLPAKDGGTKLGVVGGRRSDGLGRLDRDWGSDGCGCFGRHDVEWRKKARLG